MLKTEIVYTEADLRAIDGLNGFLPDKIFDSHAHVIDSSFLPGTHKAGEVNTAGVAEYRKNMMPMLRYPRELYANLITFPDSAMALPGSKALSESDKFLVRQLEEDADTVGEIMVAPHENCEDIESRLVHPRIRGLKCYFTLSPRQIHGDESPEEYLPSSMLEVADRHGMVITLHLAKAAALSAPENIDFVCSAAKKYPDATIILAHSARAFCAHTVMKNIDRLKDLSNVWFDFSAICESPSIIKIIDTVGSSRCMWGSDYPTNTFRGKAITVADRFIWLDEKSLPNAINLGIENLYAMKEACELMHLSDSQIEDIFYNNAKRLFSV